MSKFITAKHIFNGHKMLSNMVIEIENGIIRRLIPLDNFSNSKKLKDFGSKIISPGFIDLQINGCNGILFNDSINIETIEEIHQNNLLHGTTGFLPTLITSDIKNITQSLKTVQKWFKIYGNSRGALGLHLEGPFISPQKPGIHPLEHIIKPHNEILSEIISYSKQFPIKMTIAPEVFTKDQIETLVNNNIILSIGHTNGTGEQIKNAFDYGATTVTHMFNAMSGLSARSPGAISAILSTKNIFVGVIADMLHVDPFNIKLLSDIKSNFTYLVTDSVTPRGTNIKEFYFAGKKLLVDGIKCVDDNGTLGGAILTMSKSVQNCVEICHIELEQALKMATLTPAKVLKQEKFAGQISSGSNANLITIDLKTFSCEKIFT